MRAARGDGPGPEAFQPLLGLSTDPHAAAYASLMFTEPTASRRATRAARATVARPHARRQTVRRVIGARNRVVVAVDGVDGRDGPERLLAPQRHRRRDVGQQRRLEGERADVGPGRASRPTPARPWPRRRPHAPARAPTAWPSRACPPRRPSRSCTRGAARASARPDAGRAPRGPAGPRRDARTTGTPGRRRRSTRGRCRPLRRRGRRRRGRAAHSCRPVQPRRAPAARPACAATIRPVGVLPVKSTASAWSISTGPSSAPTPGDDLQNLVGYACLSPAAPGPRAP